MTDAAKVLFDEIKEALEKVIFGSVEIYVQDKKVTQITVRNIKKTSVSIEEEKPLTESEEKEDNARRSFAPPIGGAQDEGGKNIPPSI